MSTQIDTYVDEREFDHEELYGLDEYEEINVSCESCGSSTLNRFTYPNGPDDYVFVDVCPVCGERYEE